MNAYLVRIELRRRRWSLVLLGLLVAAVVMVTVASLAGADGRPPRSTATSRAVDPPDAMAFGDAGARAGLASSTPSRQPSTWSSWRPSREWRPRTSTRSSSPRTAWCRSSGCAPPWSTAATPTGTRPWRSR